MISRTDPHDRRTDPHDPRDIHDLMDKGILRDTGEGGRSKNYELLDLVDFENGAKK